MTAISKPDQEVVANVKASNSIGYTSLYLTMTGLIPLTVFSIIPSSLEGMLVLPWYSWLLGAITLFGFAGMAASAIALLHAKKANRAAYDLAFK